MIHNFEELNEYLDEMQEHIRISNKHRGKALSLLRPPILDGDNLDLIEAYFWALEDLRNAICTRLDHD